LFLSARKALLFGLKPSGFFNAASHKMLGGGVGDVQPLMIFSSDVPGALYLNGRYAGELAAEAETALPVAPRGPLMIEHRPLVSGYLPMARRLTLSGGRPISLSDAGGWRWPRGLAARWRCF
jgi:hypothetical protein